MKSKNVFVLIAAVVCGLIAVAISTKLGARGPAIETIEVLVAKKDIPVGTAFDEKNIPDLVGKKTYPVGVLSSEVVREAESMKGKKLVRTIRAGEPFPLADINATAGIALPPGKKLYSIKIDNVRAVTGFVEPGSYVDVLAMVDSKLNKSRKVSKRILVNMLVVATDNRDRRAEGGGPGVGNLQNLQSVSLAVTDDQAKLLHLAENQNGDLRLVLLSDEDAKDNTRIAEPMVVDEQPVNVAPEEKKPTTESIVFCKKDIPLNTKITAGNLDDFFELKSFPIPVPSKAIKDIASLKDKVVIVPQLAELPLFDSALSDKELVKEKPVVQKPKPSKTPKVHHEVIIIGPTSKKVFHYEGTTLDNLSSVDEPTKDEGDETAKDMNKEDSAKDEEKKTNSSDENKKPNAKNSNTEKNKELPSFPKRVSHLDQIRFFVSC